MQQTTQSSGAGRFGVQVDARGADLGDDLVEVLDVLGDPRGHRRGRGQLLGAVQGQADPGQPPDDVLVQVPGDPVPVGEHQQFVLRRKAFGALHRQRGLVGEGARQLQVILTESGEPAVPTASSTPDSASSAPSGTASAGPHPQPEPGGNVVAVPVTVRGRGR